jgi:hypothetical protein
MSKYNLIDIYEQYQIGSGWTNDFDYDGMLQAGLKTKVDTGIEILKKIVEDFTDVNYHREASHLYDAIEALEAGDAFEAEGKLSDFHAEIRKTQGDQGMDTSDDLGAYMASKMEENKAVDLAIETSQEKAGIKEGEEEEVEEVSSRVGSRIEGLLNISMKKKFLDAGMDLIQDLLEDDQFFIPDVIEHLSIELGKYYDGFLDQGDRLAGLEEKDAVNFDMKADEDYDEGLEDIEEALPKFKGVPSMKDIVLALIKDAKATNPEIESYVKSLKQSGDEFDDVDDYVEDFKNYVDDKALQEHFGRFMKDYQ